MSLYAEWCTALSTERARVERARDARRPLADKELLDAFNRALTDFDNALAEHVTKTGCDKMH